MWAEKFIQYHTDIENVITRCMWDQIWTKIEASLPTRVTSLHLFIFTFLYLSLNLVGHSVTFFNVRDVSSYRIWGSK